MVELDKTTSNRRKISLKRKGKMTIIEYSEDSIHNEDYTEQLKKLNEKISVIFEQYYSYNASVERIMSRRLIELIKNIISEYKNK